MKPSRWPAAWLLVLFFVIHPSPALAYLDPGSGSFLFQLIVGGLMGMLLGAKMIWRRLKSVLIPLDDSPDSHDDD